MNHNDVIFRNKKKDPRGFAYQCKAIIENCQLAHDAKNRVVSLSGAEEATFYYDGDGNRVKKTIGGVTTTHIRDHFEWAGSTRDSADPSLQDEAALTIRNCQGIQIIFSPQDQ